MFLFNTSSHEYDHTAEDLYTMNNLGIVYIQRSHVMQNITSPVFASIWVYGAAKHIPRLKKHDLVH